MLDPIRKSITVKWDQERSFKRFTEEMASWWPLKTHSVGGGKAETVVFEGWVGGRIVEKLQGGSESVWGTITAWDPPRKAAFTWHPGGSPAEATLVEVSFFPTSEGTRLDLVHSRWEAMGRMAKTARRGYPIGWAFVLRIWAGRRGSLLVRVIDFLTPVTDFLQKRAQAKADRAGSASPSSS